MKQQRQVTWCDSCNVPIINNLYCPICNNHTHYIAKDLRPVFPEERLLFELLIDKPLQFLDKSIWYSNGKYFVDGKSIKLPSEIYITANAAKIKICLEKYKNKNSYDHFNRNIKQFITANQNHINYLTQEAMDFIISCVKKYEKEKIIVTFSGGKDSTVVSDLVIKALHNPSIPHFFADTTLEDKYTMDYVERIKRSQPKLMLRTVKNKEQDFYKVCEDIGPPARQMRWCCTMFKTGPLAQEFNNIYKNSEILTFYGVRKHESSSRSKYDRISKNAASMKITKQRTASPIFDWFTLDIWLYILSEKLDFNYNYRIGHARAGCWLCPNETKRAMFLNKIYLTEEYNKWRDFLIKFATEAGRENPEVYIDKGSWTFRQGGNGMFAAKDIKVEQESCTTEQHANIYKVNKPINKSFYNLFIPFGKVSFDLGRKLVNEVLCLDYKTNVPILSIQPHSENSVKIKTINVSNHNALHTKVGYQIKKFNACRYCLKCESICPVGAISLKNNTYTIDNQICVRCQKCISNKYINGGCLMNKILYTKGENNGFHKY